MIKPAHELQKAIHEKVKQEKFDSILRMQIEAIENSMSEFRNNIRFYFADSEQYRRDFEKQWRNEFYNKAVGMFENNGYHITEHSSYTLISW